MDLEFLHPELMGLSPEERKKARDRAYYVAHREERLAQRRAYYAAHREQQSGYFRAWYAKHREEHKEYVRTHGDFKRKLAARARRASAASEPTHD